MGFGHRIYKSYDPRARIIKRVADEVFEVTGQEPAARDRAGAGAHCASGRVLRRAQALPERRLLLGSHLRGDGLPHRHVHGAVRHPADGRLAGAVGRDASRPGDQNRAAAPDLRRRRQARLRPRRRDADMPAPWCAGARWPAPFCRWRCSPRRDRVSFGADAPAFDSGRAFEHVRQLVAIGPRPAGSAGAAQTRRYITTQLAALGLTAKRAGVRRADAGGDRSRWRTSSRGSRAARPERVILAGHYDTKLFRDFRFVGANDGGSSTAMLLELARVLKARRNPLDDRAGVLRRRGSR